VFVCVWQRRNCAKESSSESSTPKKFKIKENKNLTTAQREKQK